MAVVTKTCFYSNTPRFIFFDFYCRIFVNEGVARIMNSREEWYDRNAVKEQNQVAFYVQPTLDTSVDQNFEFYQDIIEIATVYPRFPSFPNFEDNMVPVEYIIHNNNKIFVQLGTNFAHVELSSEAQSMIKNYKEEFENLLDEIQKDADSFPNCPLRQGLTNFPYLAKYHEDNLWYRYVSTDGNNILHTLFSKALQ